MIKFPLFTFTNINMSALSVYRAGEWTGMITGIILMILAVICVIAGTIIFFYQRRLKQENKNDERYQEIMAKSHTSMLHWVLGWSCPTLLFALLDIFEQSDIAILTVLFMLIAIFGSEIISWRAYSRLNKEM